MFHVPLRPGTRRAAVAQIVDEARIARGEAAELGSRHPRLAKENLDLADKHRATLLSLLRLDFAVVARQILLV